MKKYYKTYAAALIFSVVVTMALTYLRSIALVTEFDSAAVFYVHGAKLPRVFSIVAVASIIVVALLVYFMRSGVKKLSPTPNLSSPIIIFTSSLLAFMTIAYFILTLNFGMKDGFTVMEKAALVLSLPAAMYHLIGTAIPMKNKNIRLIFSIAMILWLFTVLMSVYFRKGVIVNNPNRTLELAALSVVLLFFANEGRFDANVAQPTTYIFLGLTSIIIGGLYVLPNIILTVMRIYPDSLNVAFMVVYGCMWLYILLRMYHYARDIRHIDSNSYDSAIISPYLLENSKN
ncbi:MAG: hypothetical protein ACOYIJ_06770 [Eubacteriales bacterium]|jgi:hypothetical protein